MAYSRPTPLPRLRYYTSQNLKPLWPIGFYLMTCKVYRFHFTILDHPRLTVLSSPPAFPLEEMTLIFVDTKPDSNIIKVGSSCYGFGRTLASKWAHQAMGATNRSPGHPIFLVQLKDCVTTLSALVIPRHS